MVFKFGPSGETEHSSFNEDEEISEDEMDVFLEKHHIQYYLPIWTTNTSSTNTLYEHLLNLAIQPKHITQTTDREPPSSYQVRKSPDSVAVSEQETKTRLKEIGFLGKKSVVAFQLLNSTVKDNKRKNRK